MKPYNNQTSIEMDIEVTAVFMLKDTRKRETGMYDKSNRKALSIQKRDFDVFR